MPVRKEINIGKLKEGDEAEFRTFYTHYFPFFISFAQSFLGSEEDSRDIVQEIFLSYWKSRNNFDDLVALKVFFYRSLRNRCLNVIRDSKKHVSHSLKDTAELESREYLEDAVIREEIAMVVRSEVEKLPPQARNVLRLALHGHSNQEIAEQLQISVNTVKSHKLASYSLLRHNLKNIKTILLLLAVP